MSTDDLTLTQPEIVAMIESARDLGRDAGRAAGSWAADGNSDPDHIGLVLVMLEEGDPEAYDLLPNHPDLSGQWADDPTPKSIAEEVGLDVDTLDDETFDLVDEIAQAWEEGVSETFVSSCEETLRAFLPDAD